jgi:hypothetical protein
MKALNMHPTHKKHKAILSTLFLSLILTGCDTETDSDSESTDTTDYGDVLGYDMVDTGQAICADLDGEEIDCPDEGEDYYGQDAQFDSNDLSYTDNGDGTISDNVTGLMWQQVPDDDGLSYDEAAEYAAELELAGYSDWRVPTTKELFSISDFTSGWPYIDTDYFSLAQDDVSKDEQYWTERYVGNTVEGGDDAAFGVNHGTGHIKAYPADVSGQFGNYVRVVRGGTYGDNEFVDNEDETITDSATGLMWAQDDSGEGMIWSDALEYAESSELAGYTDWRLPNIKELQSIVDYNYSPSASDDDEIGPAIDTDYFNITAMDPSDTNYETEYGYFWSSTNAYFGGDSLEYYYAWYVAFGTAPDDDGEDSHGAGAVRFDTKYEDGPLAEGGERYYNYVRLVRDVN